MVQIGDTIPSATFAYIPYTPELEDIAACGAPSKLSTDSWKGKKVVLFAVPGAFTPTCHVSHLPSYVKHYSELKAKGVDEIVCIATNDMFVMSAWGRANGTADKIIMASDTDAKFSAALGHTVDLSGAGFGTRTGRYALVIDNLKVVVLEVETNPSAMEVTSAEHILSKL
ncbi:hypothetical protein BOTBODRAFT_156630 [Botryobasidium botryosum FD-172 SS1]|uniref:Putative peroxiredoxin n=1 Tax=Botryobasidium botryosum (strain FD-172 SS1) TaxID=930990 RepID=A0A067MYS9_BOTB1|nr:hypothetical protein BOTBODRAFT_156630 [Botryobasidium botryosum FD-172 SS1]